MPTSIAATNSQTCHAPRTSPAIAGPGQNPAIPQPIPNNAAPTKQARVGPGVVRHVKPLRQDGMGHPAPDRYASAEGIRAEPIT